MKRKLLVAAICTALVLPAIPMLVHAQDATQGAKQGKKEAKKLKAVVVTGSLIPQSEIETATPVITITAQDIKRQGFTNLYQALRAQPLSTGQVQGQQFQAGFTPGAETISLLGLPPDFTLTLIDGHPLSDYPLLYNGSFSFTDISSIPLAMIDRVEIVPGGQSSLYGSAAIAGVVNIILKKHAQGVTFNYQTGGYSDGGGTSQRLQLVGGFNGNRFSLMYGLQYLDQQPIWAFQRQLTASTNSNPNPQLRIPEISYDVFDYGALFNGPFQNLDPNTLAATPCGNIAGQYSGTTIRFQTLTAVPTSINGTSATQYVPNGYACGSQYLPGYTTLMNSDHSASGYLAGSFRLNDDAELYGNLLVNIDSKDSYAGPFYNFWEAALNSGGAFYNANTNTFQTAYELYSPEEAGGLAAGATHFVNRSYNFFGGIRGSLGASDWNYDAYYARSQNNVVSNEPRPLTAKVNAFFQNQFMGPQLGTQYGYPIYAPNYANFYKSLTPAQYQSFLGIIHSSSETYTQNVNLKVTNTDLLALPAGDVGAAGILQVGDQRWSLPTNALLSSGAFYGITGSSGGGVRNNYAGALEFRVPIVSTLTADVSARYDHFHDVGFNSSSKPTYKIAFEFRPIKTLLLRANYSTAFRVPDMGYVFLGPSGYFAGVTDYYRCQVLYPGTPIQDCPAINDFRINKTIQGNNVPNADLSPITAKSWGAGFVWSPTNNFDIKADYYDVRVSNEVQYSSSSLLIEEAECRLGVLPINSSLCQFALSHVIRNQAGVLTGVLTQPFNINSERVSGITASGTYRYDAGRWGELNFTGSYNDTLKHTLVLVPGAPAFDLLHNPYYDYLSGQGASAIGPEFKTILSGSVNWNIGRWSSTIYAIRYGKIANLAAYSSPFVYQAFGATTLKPWILYNATVRYDLTPDARVTLTINNLFNRMPPRDNSYTSWPYYDFGAYNPFGRSYFVDFNYRFGG